MAPSIEQANGHGDGYVNGATTDPTKNLRQQQRAEGPATIMAIGTANPKTMYIQSEFSDFYFNVTDSNHETELKERMDRICQKSGIKKRYLHLTEEMLKKSPEICSYSENSMNARQALGVEAVPRLGAEAAERALEEWGRPRSLITHVVFASCCGIHMPGADFSMSLLLGLRPDVKRVMMYHQGCFGGGAVMRVAKDLAENNKGARVLAVAAEITIETFRGPVHGHPSLLVGSALFSDGAGAMIIGSDLLPGIEKPIFEVHQSLETIVPGTVSDIQVKLSQAGLHYFLSKELPKLVAKNTSTIFKQALEPAGSPNVNDIFWCVHPGGRAILDELEMIYALKPEKLEATRESLRDYGNMFGASVIFVLDRLRKKAKEQNHSTTGDSCDYGLLMAMGPGLTIEVSLLKAVST